MSTIKDVANLAQVSVATVSCCLSGAKNVKPSTKQKVMDAIEELKYVPNYSARNLKNMCSREIGIVLTDIDDSFHADIFKGISAFFQSKNYNINVAFSNNSPLIECEKIDEFKSKNISGLVIISCQPNETAFFESRLKNYNIPVIFLQRKPADFNCNFISFNNQETVYYITKSLIHSAYHKIALLSGQTYFSCEEESISGYKKALEEFSLPIDPHLQQVTNMSKEDAFKVSINILKSQRPQAIITTSVSIAKGALQAANVLGITVPDSMQIITLSEEDWNQSGNLQGVVHTSCSAFTMGTIAAKLLLDNILSPLSFEHQTIIMKDGILHSPLTFQPPASESSAFSNTKDSMPTLNILMAELATSHSLQAISQHFTNLYGIRLNIDIIPQNEMLDRILQDMNVSTYRYDIYMYDIPWLNYLVQSTLICDITEFIESDEFDKSRIFPENLAHCYYRDRCYGVPLVGGSQILFYRKNLFENSVIQKEFKEQYNIPLIPPKNWAQFNIVARFFTQKYSPNSPTEFGTSFTGIINEELAPEILIRLWAYGGSLFDSSNIARVYSPQNIKAFRSLLETMNYVSRDPFQTSIKDAVNDFCNGKTAMILTYSECANSIIKAMTSGTFGQVGYQAIPGKTPMSIGWNFGLNRLSSKKQMAYQFFNWLCQRNISYYMTILDGQSPVIAPYHNNEMLKLYPWLTLTEESLQYCRTRTGPNNKNALVIPQSYIEKILCEAFRSMVTKDISAEDALHSAQREMNLLFASYGY
jgi:multiple sugar transport system substrate-binding protein